MFQTEKKQIEKKNIFHAFFPRNFSVIGFVLLQVVLTGKSIEMPIKKYKTCYSISKNEMYMNSNFL